MHLAGFLGAFSREMANDPILIPSSKKNNASLQDRMNRDASELREQPHRLS